MLYDPNWKPPEIKLEPWQEVLLKAAEILEEKGWIQKYYGNRWHGYCLYGAISEAAYANNNSGGLAVKSIAMWKINFSLAHEITLVEWNDAPGRTKKEVIAKLKEVAYAV